MCNAPSTDMNVTVDYEMKQCHIAPRLQTNRVGLPYLLRCWASHWVTHKLDKSTLYWNITFNMLKRSHC